VRTASRTVLILGAAALATAVLSALVLWKPLFEWWNLRRFRSGELPTRLAAIERLVSLRSVKAVPVFLGCGSHLREEVRLDERVQEILKALGPDEMRRLSAILFLEDPSLRLRLVEVHGAIPEPRPSILPVLTDALGAPEAGLRRWAAEELGRLGAEAGPAILDLRRALADPSDLVRLWARIALWKIDPGANPPDPDEAVSASAEAAGSAASPAGSGK
jgi:hypothetical protein